MAVLFLAGRITAVTAIERQGLQARSDQNDGVGLTDVFGVAQEKFHAGLLRCEAGRLGQSLDRLAGDRDDLDQVDTFALGGRASGDHDLPGDFRNGLLAALSFVDNHTLHLFFDSCYAFRCPGDGTRFGTACSVCPAASSLILSSVRRKTVHSSIGTAPSER